MKIKTMVLATILMLGSVMTGMALIKPGAASATSTTNYKASDDKVKRLPMLQLQCSNSGGQQDVAKTPFVTNSTGKTLPKGKKLFWQSSDGDKGVIELDAPLAPGKSAIGRGRPGQNYTCTASTAVSLL